MNSLFFKLGLNYFCKKEKKWVEWIGYLIRGEKNQTILRTRSGVYGRSSFLVGDFAPGQIFKKNFIFLFFAFWDLFFRVPLGYYSGGRSFFGICGFWGPVFFFTPLSLPKFLIYLNGENF